MSEQEAPQGTRLESIDFLRGLVMVLMLLDHTRDFLHVDGLTANPSSLATTTPWLFFTRWVTHFCAPTFVLLAGTSARLAALRGLEARSLAGYLVRRGLFLVALELVVIRPAIWFQFDPGFLAQLQVIWVIGWALVVLAGFVRFPPRASLVFGLVLVLGHDLLDGLGFNGPARTPGQALWALLHQRAPVLLGPNGPTVFVHYPLVPWVGLAALGYALGGMYALDVRARRRLLARIGFGAVVAFLVLRGTNLYGDPRPWSAQAEGWRSLASFLAAEKYPPSLAFLCMTLGPALLLLTALEGGGLGVAARPVIALGRVPLFFYVLQWPTVHLVAWLFQALAGQPLFWEIVDPLTLESLPPGCGFSLPVVYAGWLLGLACLLPLCLWYGGFKRRHPERVWLHYL